MMRKRLTIPWMAVALVMLASRAAAAPVNIAGLEFEALSPDVTIASGGGTGTSADPIRLLETVSGTDVTIAIRGLSSFGNPAGTGHADGFYIEKVVTNATGVAWTYYDHELQTVLGSPSGNGDGLSFAQGSGSVRPWTSTHFSTVNEIVDPRDFVNFSGGIVNPGEVVTFRYVITDNQTHAEVYLRQRPNYQPGDPNPVPEPSSVLLVTLALPGLYLARRRRLAAA